MRIWIDCESGETITEKQLYYEFCFLKSEQPDEYNYSFADYIRNCESKNGTLTRLEA